MTFAIPGIFANGARGAVSLTYDDALDAHLDVVIPQLESFGLRGTFYIPTRAPMAEAWRARPNDWRAAAARGHEIANHTQYHPCSIAHDWVKPNFSLEAYSLARMEPELVGATNEIRKVTGVDRVPSFAYPCCEEFVGPERTSYRPMVNRLFPAARGGAKRELADPFACDLAFVPAWAIHEKTQLADAKGFIDEAIDRGHWAVLIFHGVGGGHAISVSAQFHVELCDHIVSRKSDLWCDTFLNVVTRVRESTNRPWVPNTR